MASVLLARAVKKYTPFSQLIKQCGVFLMSRNALSHLAGLGLGDKFDDPTLQSLGELRAKFGDIMRCLRIPTSLFAGQPQPPRTDGHGCYCERYGGAFTS